MSSDPRRRRLRTAGLFAGIGGLELGLERAGHKTKFLCEIDPSARAVLKRKFRGVRKYDDITTLAELPPIDVITAGFPCQDLSQAGRTEGIHGKRSGLVAHVWRLLEMREVPWVVLENVPFMLKLHGGRALDVVITALETLGYRWAYRIVDAHAFGIPQRRERVFIVAARDDDPRGVLLADDAGKPRHVQSVSSAIGFYWTEGNSGWGQAVDAIPPLKGGSTVGIPSPPAICLPDGRFIKPDIRDAERLQGFDPDWTLAAEDVGRASYRWKLVGNAVSVSVATWIGERLAVPGHYAADKDEEMKPNRWPAAAWGDGKGKRYVADVSSWPKAYKGRCLADFLEYPGSPLTYRASHGFLTRARASHLHIPRGFLDKLAAHASAMKKLESAARAAKAREAA